MSANARLLVEIAASLGSFREDLGKASAIAESNAKKIEKAFDRTKDQLKDVGKAILGAFGISLGIEGVIRGLEAITHAAIDEQRSIQQLETALNATGHAAGLTREQLEALGKTVENTTVFDDEDIRKATTALLRFREISGDTFKEVLRIAPDVATVMGTDLVGAVQLLGKAIIDPSRGMRVFKEAGVALSEQQIDLAARMRETGNVVGAAKIALDAITESTGGASESDTKGAYGGAKRLSRAWGDLVKALGAPIVADTQGLEHATGFLDRLSRKIKETDLTQSGTLAAKKKAFLDLLEVFGLKDETFPVPKPVAPEDAALKQAEERTAELGKAASAEKIARDKAYAEEQRILKQRASSAATFYGAELAQQKAFLDRQQAQDDFAYSRGGLTVDEFYDRRKSALSELQRFTVEANEKQIQASRALIAAPSTSAADKLAEEQKIAVLEQQSLRDREGFTAARTKADQDRIVAIERLGDAYSELAEKIALANGEDAKAAGIAFERENRAARRADTHIRDTGNPQESAAAQQRLDDTDRLGRLADARARLSEETRKYGNTIDELSIKQGYADLEAQTGALSEIGLMNKRAELAKAYIPILSAQADAQQKIVDAMQAGPDKDAATLRVQRLRLEIEQLGAASTAVAKKFEDLFENDLVNALDSFIDGTKSAKDAFKDFAKSLQHDITHEITKDLVHSIFGGGGNGGVVGSLLASIFGTSGKQTPGSTSGGGGANTGLLGALFAGNIGSSLSGWFNSLSAYQPGGFADPAAAIDTSAFLGFAGGTNSAPGGWAMVGERGPEIVNLPRGAQVIPNHELMARRADRAGASMTVHQTINNLPGANRQSGVQAARESVRRLQQAT